LIEKSYWTNWFDCDISGVYLQFRRYGLGSEKEPKKEVVDKYGNFAVIS
jgi:hypothetical protein